MRMMTWSLGRITIQALTSGEPSAARTTCLPNGSKPMTRPPVTAAEETMNERRFIFMASPQALAGALAAAWIAARTSWNVPQRQMLVIAALMSASVGLGFAASSAAAAMIMPDWQ